MKENILESNENKCKIVKVTSISLSIIVFVDLLMCLFIMAEPNSIRISVERLLFMFLWSFILILFNYKYIKNANLSSSSKDKNKIYKMLIYNLVIMILATFSSIIFAVISKEFIYLGNVINVLSLTKGISIEIVMSVLLLSIMIILYICLLVIYFKFLSATLKKCKS